MVDTLTDTDYVSVIDFSSNALAYAPALVQATEANLAEIRTWIDGLRASGTTDFNDAFATRRGRSSARVTRAAPARAVTRCDPTTYGPQLPPPITSAAPSPHLAPPPLTPPHLVVCVHLPRPSALLWQVLLFLTDGKPDAPWGDEQYAEVKRQAAELGPNHTAPNPSPA